MTDPERSGSKTIARAALIVSLGILLSRLLGYARVVVLGSLLGVDVNTDLYTDAFLVPDFLFFLMAGGYLSITLVPLLTQRLARDGEKGAREVFTAVFRVVVGLMVVLTTVLMIWARPLVEVVFPKLDPAGLDRLTALMRITLPSQVFFAAGTLFMAAQYARRQFVVPTLAPLIYNLGIIAGGLISAATGDPSPEAFLWGGLVGAFVGNFALQAWGARRAGAWLISGVPLKHPAIGAYFALAFPLMIGQSAVGLDEQWPRLIGQFAGTGATSQLYFARQLNMLPVGVIAQAAGVAAYPFLAGLFSDGKMAEMRTSVLRSVRAAFTVGGLAMAGVAALAVPIVKVAYQYGRFNAAAAGAVAGLLAYYAFSIPFWSAHQVYTRAFYAQHRMWTPVVIGTAVTVVTVPLLFVLVNAIGAPGVALGSTVGVTLYTISIAAAWHREGDRAETKEIVSAAGRVAVTTAIAGGSGFGVLHLVGHAAAPLALLVAGVVTVATYGAAGRLIGLTDLDVLWKRLRSRSQRTSVSQP